MPSRFKVLLAPSTIADAVEIGNYINEANPAAAKAFFGWPAGIL
jgi:hypothetical protein